MPWVASRERALTLMERDYRVLVFEFENRTDGKYESAKRAKGDLKFLKNTKHLFLFRFFSRSSASLKNLSLMFQGNGQLSCKVLRKIEECCAVIDSLAVCLVTQLIDLRKI